MDNDLKNSCYVLNHVFFPPKLPQEDDFNIENEHTLSVLVHQSAQAYKDCLPARQKRHWESIIRMLRNLCISQDSPTLSAEFMNKSIVMMNPGDTLAFLIREQNAGLIMRKFRDKTVFESFEVSPSNAAVMGAKGKLICSYSGPAIAVPSETVDNSAFRKELASFLVQMNVDRLDSAPTTTKAGSTVVEIRDTAHPRYITQLLTGILRGIGEVAEVTRIRKRIGDDVLYQSAEKPWRRSPLWLVIRVALQTSLHEKHGGHTEYKSFMAFMMARMLRLVLDKGFSSDNLFFMRGKISRRLYKLGSAVPGFVLQEVQEVGQATGTLLQRRWTMVQNRQATSARWAPDDLDILGNTYLALPKSESYLLRILQGNAPQSFSYTFQPKHHSRYRNTRDFCAFESNNGLLKAFAADSFIALADFESAVQNHLDNWVADHLLVQSACVTIASCITQYSESALKLYDSNPENQSMMILTVFHLWVALDRIAVAQCPLLGDYSPEVPLGLLEPLLLRRSSMLQGLASIQEHLRKRHRRAHTGWSVFADDVNMRTFAVRYFDGSTEHQSLQSRIETAAQKMRQQKVRELHSQNASHQDLTRRYQLLTHENLINNRGRSYHDSGCQRCSLERQAKKMRIGVHEWPLPQDPLKAKAIVFELRCPVTFGVWRTTTYQILYDICSLKSNDSANPPVSLESYSGFQNYLQHNRVPRITFASTTKSFLNAHYKTTRIPSDESSVCVQNGLNFRLFDKLHNTWAATPFTECSVVRYCTLQLPKGPYGSLQYTVDTTLHTSNQVLANQSECDQDLNLHEYIAFSSLGSGCRLQWLNLAREIRARSLSFCREEVHILVTQTAWQIGHLSSDGDWEWHAPLSNVDFGLVLLQELQDLILGVEENWLEIVSVRTITTLASRLLASQNDAGVIDRVYTLLRKARAVTFRWMHQLVEKLPATVDEDKVREFQQRICEVAATCRGTYDVDPDHVPFLLRSNEDVAILVECAIAVYDNTPSNLADCPLDFKRLLDRDRRWSHSLEMSLQLHIRKDRGGLDRAIAAIWTGYRPGSDWQALQPPNDRWLIAVTTTNAGQDSQPVQLNLLEGQLLINGKPLGRLPQNIVKHSTYSRIFGQKILDVIPADIPGMDFATRSLVSNHQVFFALRQNDTQLVIRARHESKMLELVSHKQFVGDLPTLLVEKYTHWLDLSNGEIELRPIEDRWGSSTNNWRIHVSANGRSRMLKGSSLLLVDIHSSAFRMISARLKPLEYADHLIATYALDDHLVSVELPRFRLSFFLNGGKDLECQNMPGMIIDPNQSTGTMFGLSSQLVLRAKNPVAAELPRSRRVIIPFGQLRFKPQGDHASIVVDTHALSHVRYYEYKIDTDLGCLVGTVSLVSKLYKIYLHSVSSHCLPDPLTARTGTEEALHELQSPSCRSFQKLGVDEEGILHDIGSLTPGRTFYPPHLKVMQSVKWAALGTMAQHHGFYMATQSILEHANRLQMFHGQSEISVRHTCSLSFAYLSERAGRRSAVFYPDDCADPPMHTDEDIVHSSRDFTTIEGATDETLVCNVAAMVNQWPTTLNTSLELFKTLEQWVCLSGRNQGLSLSYSRDWLQRNLAETWISLYDRCRDSSRAENGFELVFSLSSMAYCAPQNRDFIPTLMAFATIPRFRTLSPPPWPNYDLAQAFQPHRDELLDIVRSFAISFENSPEASLPAQYEESETCLGQRRFSAFKVRLESQIYEYVDRLLEEWPCKEPNSPLTARPWLFDTPMVISKVRALFMSWFSNKQLRDHMELVQAILNEAHGSYPTNTGISSYQFASCSEIAPSLPSRIVFDQLFERDAPHIALRLPSPLETPELRKTGLRSGITDDLPALISQFQSHENSFYRHYGNALDESRRHLVNDAIDVSPNYIPYSMEILTTHRDQCKVYVEEFFASLHDSLSPSNPLEMMMYISGLWPRITLRSLLRKLAFHSSTTLTDCWQTLLISLAQGMLLYQSSQRLLRSALKENHEDFFKELKNQVCHSQDAKQCLDWLLIQVDNDFLARPIQIHVAQQMINPDSRKNTVLQLNMGEGKSSVIVPMVAATLADGKKLVRVIVLKSLAGQMFQLLVERLSGLANRQVFYMPFSRSVKLDAGQAQLIQDLYNDCMRVGGILVVQPEHILSFKLMGIEQLFSSTSSIDCTVADAILDSQRWLEYRSRDILDESNEILHVRYQLIYTMGQQRSLEDHPDRWTTVQQVFSLVERHTSELQKQFPMGVEVQESRHGSFPPLRILHLDAGKALVALIAEDVLDGALPNCPYGIFPRHVRCAALQMITEANISEGAAEVLTTYCKGSGQWKGLLLLRGLLAQGLLVYALKERRWRVDYGLDPSRLLLAVPYHAKDIPALRAEFGHPDVAIVLTCLSYYYGGLSDNQLNLSFQLLYKLDNPTMEYENWVHNDPSVPLVLHQLSGVNIRDPEQCEQQLFPLFWHNCMVIDFYLSQVVFPKEAKEFPEKLTTSGWDIAESKSHVTTGFSGTNNNQYLLPTSITQRDPLQQLSTNAKVLGYLLQPENNHYMCVRNQYGERVSAQGFLELLVEQTPEIRVLLDVGAQMLEMQNVELAKHWLSLKPDVPAVIYFGDNDQMCVLARDGTVEAFISSPFNQRLDKCLVYLDDVHTRGTDLKLPRDSRAAVTLGPKVTKDRLLQGCMRMRRLGHGQSVMFFAPLKVHRTIQKGKQRGSDPYRVEVRDILRWAMLETCADIQHHVPHWAEQGVDHNGRESAWREFVSSGNLSVERLMSSLLQPEEQTLEKIYGLPLSADRNSSGSRSHHAAFDIPELRERCQMLGVTSFTDIRMEEEQEREVDHEAENERQIERPPKAEPATHAVHKDVRQFVRTGLICPLGSSQFLSVFSPLKKSFAALPQDVWSPNLIATKDFSTTIQNSYHSACDYLRPVNWIVSSCAQGRRLFVILSPYEVNELLPEIHQSKEVHLHIYSPKVTQSMRSLDDLQFFCIPPLPSPWVLPRTPIALQLNLCAGQLYLPDYQEYLQLCNFLGIYTKELRSAGDIPIQLDGFIRPEHRKDAPRPGCPFTESPVPFLKELIGLRRKGGFTSTHMGKILYARPLREDDFED